MAVHQRQANVHITPEHIADDLTLGLSGPDFLTSSKSGPLLPVDPPQKCHPERRHAASSHDGIGKGEVGRAVIWAVLELEHGGRCWVKLATSDVDAWVVRSAYCTRGAAQTDNNSHAAGHPPMQEELFKPGCLTPMGEAKVSANEIGRPNGHTQHDEAALRWIECRISDPPMFLATTLGQASGSNASSVGTQQPNVEVLSEA